MKRARVLSCRLCARDLTAKPTEVPSPLRPGSVTRALRAPPRVEITIQFAGYSPPKTAKVIALCPECAERTAWSATGIPFVLPDEK